jgi:hypothetical protein
VSLYLCEKKTKKEPIQKSLPGCVSILVSKKLANADFFKETPRCICLRGVMTLEAVVILPLLASFFVSVLFFFRVMQVQTEMQKALDDTARQMAVYLADADGTVDASTLTLIKGMFLGEIKEYILPEQYVTGGKIGISLAASTMTEQELHLTADYYMSPPVKLLGSQGIWIEQHADCRKWNGWKESESLTGEDYFVYVTEYGTVYHRNRACTYLELTIQMVSLEQAVEMQNKNGRYYRSCELCGDTGGYGNAVYLTDEGECYHTDLGCSGIKRSIFMIRISEVGNLRECSKCSLKGLE